MRNRSATLLSEQVGWEINIKSRPLVPGGRALGVTPRKGTIGDPKHKPRASAFAAIKAQRKQQSAGRARGSGKKA